MQSHLNDTNKIVHFRMQSNYFHIIRVLDADNIDGETLFLQ